MLIQHEQEQSDVFMVGGSQWGAELTENGDFHSTFVWLNERGGGNLNLMGFGDKKLAAPGPPLLSLSGSSVAQPIGELRASVALETREHRAGRHHGKRGRAGVRGAVC